VRISLLNPRVPELVALLKRVEKIPPGAKTEISKGPLEIVAVLDLK